MMRRDTLPRLLRRNAASMGDRPAMREKRHGIWQTSTWSAVRGAGAGVRPRPRRCGLPPRRPAGRDRRQPPAALLPHCWQRRRSAASPCRSIRTRSPRSSSCMLEHADVSRDRRRGPGAGRQAPVGEGSAAEPDAGSCRSIRCGCARWQDTRGSNRLRRAPGQRGAASRQAPGRRQRSSKARPTISRCCLCLAAPAIPGVMLTHANLLAAAHAIAAVEDVRPTDEGCASCRWPGSATCSTRWPLACSSVSPATVRKVRRRAARPARDRPDRAPGGAAGDLGEPGSLGSRIGRRMRVRVKRAAFELGPPAGRSRRSGCAARAVLAAAATRSLLALGDRLVFAACATSLGLRRLRWAHTGGTPVGPEVWPLLPRFGVNLKQSYGPTELAGLVTVQRDGESAPPTPSAGRPGTELRIDDRGEVLMRVCRHVHGLLQAARGDA